MNEKKLEQELEEGYQALAEQNREDAEFFLAAQAEVVLVGEKPAVSGEKNPPRSAADPRPGNKPYYIDPCCPSCGTPLVLLDQLENPEAPMRYGTTSSSAQSVEKGSGLTGRNRV